VLSPRWRKVLRDLWGNKARTVLVVLSIAVGVFAVGMIANTQVILSRDLAEAYAASNPASATLYMQPFEEGLVRTVRNMPEVKEAQGSRSYWVRLKVGPDEWANFQLRAVSDYDDVRVNKFWPESGAWPPERREVLLERSSLAPSKANVGDTIVIELPNGQQRELRIAGLVHDLSEVPTVFWGGVNGYITFETLEWLGGSRNYDDLDIVVAENPLDREHIGHVTERVRDRIERSGWRVYQTEIPEPGKHWGDDVIQSLLLILSALGFLSLFLSGFLVINIVTALLTQQVRQIGMMKAVGGRRSQIMGMYLSMILIFGLLALAVAVPLGALAARVVMGYLAQIMNFDIVSSGIPLQVLALQTAVGLIVPLLSALYPIIAGTRITAQEALSEYGLGKGKFGTGLVDRLLERVRGFSRPLLLSLRNTFRRKGRLALTLATLSLAGAIFIAVFSVRASLFLELEDVMAYFNYDVEVDFAGLYRITRIEREALRVPGVVRAESWGFHVAYRKRADGTEGETIRILAAPNGTDMIQPTIYEGRWLEPTDRNALVVTNDFLQAEPDVAVGDEIKLRMGDRETTWHIVGLTGRLGVPFAYTNYQHFARLDNSVGYAGVVVVETEQDDPRLQSEVARALEERFKRVGLQVAATMTMGQIRATNIFQFNVLFTFLMIMAILLAVVGGLGLMGTMSLNVFERIREIGVMRAIGASDGAVLQVVIVESIVIGITSWVLGTIAALPLSRILSDAIGIAFIDKPLAFEFSVGGVLVWFVVAIIVATLASFLPARTASRLTVREVLAYE
jgi:putative ABC transport system permease protein